MSSNTSFYFVPVFGLINFFIQITVASYKCIKEVAHLTKVNGIDNPVVFHSLADITQPRDEDDPFSIASWPCVLTGLLTSVTVCKISQKELFKVVQVNKRYSVIDLWNVNSLQDFNELEPLQTDAAPKFDIVVMRNSVPIPPFMFRELTRAKAWETGDIAHEAIKAMKEMMADSAELEIIMDEQEELDVQETPEDSTPEYRELQRAENEGKQRELNKSWQQLAEKCGLGAEIKLPSRMSPISLPSRRLPSTPSLPSYHPSSQWKETSSP